MRSLVPWLLPLALAAGCRGAAPRPEPGPTGPPAAQLRTWVSIDEAACDAVEPASAAHRLQDQMELARAVAELADARFLATVKGRVPFEVAKAPWKDRPVIELSLEDLRLRRAPEGSGAPDRVTVRLRLRAELPDAAVSIDRALTYERELLRAEAATAEPAAPALACLTPTVEEVAAMAAAWLVEAATPPAATPPTTP